VKQKLNLKDKKKLEHKEMANLMIGNDDDDDK
jgi:hypothetical protein